MKKIFSMILVAGSLHVSAQNVGIGNTNPTEKLHVTGNIKADSFKYTSPKTLYYAVPDGAFTARSSNETVQKTFGNGGAYITNGTTTYGLVAPVNLPHNAKLISVKADFYDVSTTQDLICYFVVQFSSGFSFNTTLTSSGNAGLNTQMSTLNTPLVIDNSANAYEVFVAPATGVWATPDIAIRRVIFAYTLSEAQ